MKSPFPGMDPYLERHWGDIHTKLIAYASDELNERLPDDLIARAEESVAVEAESDESDGEAYRRSIAPDVRIFETFEQTGVVRDNDGAVALAPFRLASINEPEVQRNIEIIDVRGGQRIVTVVEFISPSNKTIDRDEFIAKRKELLAGGVNFVEIDLTRAGDWKAALQVRVQPKAMSAYRAAMWLPGRRPKGWLHPFSIREPLPEINIPLRLGEKPCKLEIQSLINRVYQNGRYGRTIDYLAPCEPPLNGDDVQWADDLLRAAGRRA